MTKKTVVLSLVALFILSFFCVLLDQAEARRFGGGRSFGSKPSYQRSAPQPQKSAPSQNQPAQQGQAATASPVAGPRPWGGMLGGLLMGGLIGSLLFGGGQGLAGPGLIDILLFGGLAYFLIRYLRARRMAAEGIQETSFAAPPGSAYPEERWSAAGSGQAGQPVTTEAPAIPPDFDQADFLKGAKAMYARLQDSWDRRDLEDIREFTSPEVWDEIRRQAEEQPQPGKTQIVLVNARLLEVKKADGQTVASVFYDVLLRETPQQSEPSQVQEVWHFSSDEKKPGSFWVLEGIQQVGAPQ